MQRQSLRFSLLIIIGGLWCQIWTYAESMPEKDIGEHIVHVVKTPREFVAALHGGAVHIELQEHLDISALSWWESNSYDAVAFSLPHTLLSIRGNCGTPFPEPSAVGLQEDDALLTQKPQQCLLVVGNSTTARGRENDLAFLHSGCLRQAALPLWLEGLYIKAKPSSLSEAALYAERHLWMSNVTLHGSKEPGVGALLVPWGSSFIADSTFVDWSARDRGVVAATSTSVSLLRTTFLRNSVSHSSALLVTDRHTTSVRLEGCTWPPSNTAAPGITPRGGGPPAPPDRVRQRGPACMCDADAVPDYEDWECTRFGMPSDDDDTGRPVWSDEEVTAVRGCDPDGASAPLADADESRFLNVDHPAFVKLQAEVRDAQRIQPDASVLEKPYAHEHHSPCEEPSSAHGPPLGLIMGIVAPVAFALCCVLPFNIVMSRRGRSRRLRAEREASDHGSEAGGDDGTVDDPRYLGPDLKAALEADVPKHMYRVDVHLWSAVPDEESQGKLADDTPDIIVLASDQLSETRLESDPAEAMLLKVSAELGKEGADTCSHDGEDPCDRDTPITSAVVLTVAEASQESSVDSGQEGPSSEEDQESQEPDREQGQADQQSQDGSAHSLSGADHACVICYEVDGDHALIPCGHGGYCKGCARSIFFRNQHRWCPMCRSFIDTVVKVDLETPVGSHGHVSRMKFMSAEHSDAL